MTMEKEFSVLMSVYDKESPNHLQESIESLLSQTLLPNEIVIVKDGLLTPQLEDVLNKYADNRLFKIIGFNENRGLGLALNYGVEQCTYDIIARMDSDDISAKDRFEKQINTLIDNGFDMIGSNTVEFIDTIDNVQSKRYMPETNEEIITYSKIRNPFIHPSVVVKKQVLLDAGNYRDMYLCEDYDMWVRVLDKGYKAYNIQENLVFMRVGKDFYRRRGGLKYCKAILRFKKLLYKNGFIKYNQYLKTKFATIVVSLMPGFLREFVYKKFLRN